MHLPHISTDTANLLTAVSCLVEIPYYIILTVIVVKLHGGLKAMRQTLEKGVDATIKKL